jgi:hypothetical protein
MDFTLYLINAFFPLYALIISKGLKKPTKQTKNQQNKQKTTNKKK